MAAKTESKSQRSRPADDKGRLPFMTGKDLLDSGLIGMWKNREEALDSAAFARKLRRLASRRRSS